MDKEKIMLIKITNENINNYLGKIVIFQGDDAPEPALVQWESGGVVIINRLDESDYDSVLFEFDLSEPEYSLYTTEDIDKTQEPFRKALKQGVFEFWE
jgi:hypothetical protein